MQNSQTPMIMGDFGDFVFRMSCSTGRPGVSLHGAVAEISHLFPVDDWLGSMIHEENLNLQVER